MAYFCHNVSDPGARQLLPALLRDLSKSQPTVVAPYGLYVRRSLRFFIHLCVHVYVCLYIYIYTYIYIYIYIYICMCVRVHGTVRFGSMVFFSSSTQN